jgi:hypothetical protein
VLRAMRGRRVMRNRIIADRTGAVSGPRAHPPRAWITTVPRLTACRPVS